MYHSSLAWIKCVPYFSMQIFWYFSIRSMISPASCALNGSNGYNPSRYLDNPTGTTETLSTFGRYSISFRMLYSSSLPSFTPLQSTICPFIRIPAALRMSTFFRASPAKRLFSILQRSSGFMVWKEILIGDKWYLQIRSIS